MAGVQVSGFDHLVLRVRDVETSLAWYVEMLGLAPVRVQEWREDQVPFPSVRVSPDTIIDIIRREDEVGERNVDHYCLVASADTISSIDADRESFRVVAGPVTRYGARGDGWSIYVLDPDENVVELRTYDR